MLSENLHPTDQELLLAADGELPARRAARVRSHLAACWNCRARMSETEGTISDFTRAYRQGVDPQVPPIAGSRARLRSQLVELAAKRDVSLSQRLFQFTSATGTVAGMCVVFLAVLVVGRFLLERSTLGMARSEVDPLDRGAIPNPSLTPGATRPVMISDVCAMPHEQVIREVSVSLRQEVYQEYGIVKAGVNDYEIDYLIAPGLGGVEDIHNLWPEPYLSSTWNAHVKDDLEEHLHQMVCTGKLNLSTAQRDIAVDWIAAYKKYFHTDRPLSLSSNLIRSVGTSFISFTTNGNAEFHARRPVFFGLDT